jgi:hypothetical protein
LGVGWKADYLALQNNYCCEIQRSENRIKSAEFTEGGRGSKSTVLPMMTTTTTMMMMMMIIRERERPFCNLRADWVLA